MEFPNEIKNIVGDLLFTKDNIGRSEDIIYIFENKYVLKISKDSKRLLREKEKIDWISNYILGPKSLIFIKNNNYNYYLRECLDGESLISKRFIQNPTERIYPIRNFNSNFNNENNFNPNFSYLPNINRQNSFFLNRNKKNRSATINTEQLNNLILEKIEINQKRIKDVQKQNNIFRNYFNNISKKLSNNNFNAIRNLNNNNTIFDKEPITEKRLKKIKSDLNIV